MKTMLLAALAALSLGIGSAYAGDGEGPASGYAYPGYVPPGSAAYPAGSQARVAPAQNGDGFHIFGTHSQGQGTWLFPPNQTGGGDNG
jgi:hypothetical protein